MANRKKISGLWFITGRIIIGLNIRLPDKRFYRISVCPLSRSPHTAHIMGAVRHRPIPKKS